MIWRLNGASLTDAVLINQKGLAMVIEMYYNIHQVLSIVSVTCDVSAILVAKGRTVKLVDMEGKELVSFLLFFTRLRRC